MFFFPQVAWKRLYSCSSKRDPGTLYHLRSLINRRDVRKKPEKAVTACEEFFLLVVEAHICTAAMKLFGMSSLKDEPSSAHFPEGCSSLTSEQRWKVLTLAINELLESLVDISYPPASKKKRDHVYAYGKEVISLGLLYMEFCDGIREGDGARIIRCWRYFLPMFKASGHTNYVVEAFNLLFQLQYVFTPRMKKQLMWERTINVHGKPGRNVPMDLHMEHINRACKDAMHSLGSNIDEAAVARIGKGIGEMMEVTDKFDTVNSIPQASGRHSRRSIDIDMEKVVAQLQDAEVFSNIPKRKHQAFPKFQANPSRGVTAKALKTWMKEQVKKYKMFYL